MGGQTKISITLKRPCRCNCAYNNNLLSYKHFLSAICTTDCTIYPGRTVVVDPLYRVVCLPQKKEKDAVYLKSRAGLPPTTTYNFPFIIFNNVA